MKSHNTTPGRLPAASTAALGGAIALPPSPNHAYAQGSDEIRVALIGAGGRGTGAVGQLFRTKGNVKLVSVADAFKEKASRQVEVLRRQFPDKVDVAPDTVFEGLDAFKQAIDTDCDLVVIASPSGIKPYQFEYAVSKGKHVFCEKPVASDAPGVRRFMAAVERSKQSKLNVAIGFHRRHETQYTNAIERIHNGEIGDVLHTRVYYNASGIWYRPPKPEWTEMQNQCNNWYHFLWASGDQIVEQHVHNIDMGCWAKQAYPVSANGMGGWKRRLNGDGKQSQIYDHTFVEYTFADGTTMHSQGRHLRNAFNRDAEYVQGTKGRAYIPGMIEVDGQRIRTGGRGGGHQNEQNKLIDSIMAGEVYNEGDYGWKSTFAAILGRDACYSGKVVKWDDLLAKGKDLCPDIDTWDWDTAPPTVKDPVTGAYDIPKPGIYNPFAE
ncbi:MAG: Gfo/Idh/MocA family oxidoreductase [Planctomycetota bacterium]